ncbi:hypothetical protein [Pedomonas sp. V897]|uniref:hypothetical protein n=1 Tax=Pedomonas sp. V897 TaxID=3446482 RepID=UPI003EE2D39C
MAGQLAEQAAQVEIEEMLRQLLAEEHPHLGELAPSTRLVSEAGLTLAELDEIYFTALDRLGRRPPLDDGEVRALINLNDPNLVELSRHVALNCPVMSPEEREAATRPDPGVTTQGATGLEERPPRWGMAVLLGVAAVSVIVAIGWLLMDG